MACESDDRTCKFCKRSRTVANPYTKGQSAKGPTLPFVSATYNVCVSCRNWFYCADMGTVQREALLADMVSNQSKRNEHLATVQQYEEKAVPTAAFPEWTWPRPEQSMQCPQTLFG